MFKSFRKSESGSTAIFFAVGATVVLGAAGLALTYSEKLQHEANIQVALDFAVIAGQSPPRISNELRIATAKKAFQSNWQHTRSASRILAMPQFYFVGTHLRGEAESTFHGTFSNFFGVTDFALRIDAEAVRDEGGPICVLALAPSEEQSLYVYGNANFNANKCAVHSNSVNAESISIDGTHSAASAEAFYTSGRATGNGWTPAPSTNVAPQKDPLASLPVPIAGGCDFTGLVVKGQKNLSPGTYCGGISVMSGGDARLSPGEYIIKDGPFSVTSHGVVNGENVLIALVGSNAVLDIQSGGTVKLTSPAQGTYKNVQFMSDRDTSESKHQREWSIVQAGGKLEFDGVMYLPEQNFWVVGTAHQTVVKAYSPTMTMIADTFWIQGNAVLETERADRHAIGMDNLTDLHELTMARLVD